jgi:hypothetical protein
VEGRLCGEKAGADRWDQGVGKTARGMRQRAATSISGARRAGRRDMRGHDGHEIDGWAPWEGSAWARAMYVGSRGKRSGCVSLFLLFYLFSFFFFYILSSFLNSSPIMLHNSRWMHTDVSSKNMYSSCAATSHNSLRVLLSNSIHIPKIAPFSQIRKK